jgi:hypothetical protein
LIVHNRFVGLRFKHDTVLAAVKAWPGGSVGVARGSDGHP